MPHDARTPFLRYGCALGSVLLATLLRLLLDPALGERHPFAIFYVAVMFTAWYAGLAPALVALALGLVAGSSFMLSPEHSLAISRTADLVGMGLYFFVGLTIVAFSEALRAAQRSAEAHAQEALQAKQALEQQSEERERAQAAQAQLAAIVESSPDAIIGKTPDGRIVSWNAAAERLYGYTAAEALGRTISILTPPDRADEVPEILARVQRGERVEGMETVRVRKDGTRIDVSLTVSPVRDAAGNVVGVATVARDIAEQRRATEGLRRVASGANCVLWYADVRDTGGSTLRWDLQLFDEETARRFFPVHIPPDRTYVQAWYESRLLDDKARMNAFSVQEVRAGRSYRQEFRCRRADGEIRWLAEDVQIEPIAPGHWRAVGVCTDVTELKHMEAALQARAEELQRANQAKDDFLSLLAHELRNPLAPIRHAVELLQHLGPAEPRLSRARAIIERQVQHLVRLVDDLLDVSRISRNKVLLRHERLDLTALVRNAAEARRPIIEEAGLTLTLELPEPLVWVEGDPTRLTQVVNNLLDNAAKFTDRGGAVAVGLRIADCGLETANYREN